MPIRALAIDKDSSFINSFRDLAAELSVAIGISFLERHNPKLLYFVIYFDRYGIMSDPEVKDVMGGKFIPW